MLSTVWHGLVSKTTLKSLTVKFPNKREQRPILLVPPMVNLESLRILDIDPLCHPDDVSLLIADSKKLRELKLFFSPRMRDEREPSINLHAYFGKCRLTERKLIIRSLGFLNLYAAADSGLESVFDMSEMHEITFLNSVEGVEYSRGFSFIDQSWMLSPPKPFPNIKMVRNNNISKFQCTMMGRTTGLERLYMVGQQQPKWLTGLNGQTTENDQGKTPDSTADGGSEPHNGLLLDGKNSIVAMTPPTPNESYIGGTELMKDYLDTIYKCHGSTLRHLLLKPQWRLTADELARLVRNCPNLEQLGVGVEFGEFRVLKLLLPFLPKLWAIRILENPLDSTWTTRIGRKSGKWHEEKISQESVRSEWKTVRWVGLGNYVYEIKHVNAFIADLQAAGDDGSEEVSCESLCKERSLDDVKDIEIWKLDSMAL